MSPGKLIAAGLSIISIISAGFSQINLNSIYCSAVKDGGSVGYRIDSLTTETSVGNGIAKTTMTMVVTPDNYRNIYSDGIKSTIISESPRDSIEIRMSMNPGTDFVAENLYLWVNGERQTGYIQDRFLADNQYNQIVGKRRDPAILESYGNGNLNLRVFPASSNKSRKFSIQFQHTFKNDSSGLITSSYPFQFDTIYNYYNYGAEKKPLGYFSATFNSSDDRSYKINIPGIINESFSRVKSFHFASKNIYSLYSGNIATQDYSGGKVFAWSGIDKVDGKQNIGFSVALSESTVTIDPEPQTRTIILDIRNTDWDWQRYYTDAGVNYNFTNKIRIWERAQKFAVMCLKQYVSTNQKFNLIIQGEYPEAVFKNPVSPTEENLLKAYKAIISASPSKTLSTIKAMKQACSQASDGAVILISDLYPPYYNYTNNQSVKDTTTAYSPDNENYLALMDSLKTIVKSTGAALFTICDDYNLNSIATRNINGLRYYNYNYQDKSNSFSLLPLFNKYGITDIKVTGTNNSSDIVFSNGYNQFPSIMADVKVVVPAVAMPYNSYYYPYYNEKLILNIAAKTSKFIVPSDFVFNISGRIGGLKFTKKVTVSAQPSLFTLSDNVHWASIYAEGTSLTYEQIKKTGIDYHIVTKNTALLALEPGMELWKDTVTQTLQSDVAALKVFPNPSGVAGTIAPDNSNLIDSISIEDLYKGIVSVKNGPFEKKTSQIALKLLHSGIEINFINLLDGEKFNLALFDLKGRMVASRIITSLDVSAGKFLWKVENKSFSMCRGFYTLMIKSKSFKKCIPVPVISR